MRIALCAKLDLFGAVALNLLLPRLAGHDVALFFSNKTRVDEGEVAELQLLQLLERDLPLQVLFPLLEAQPAGGRFGTVDQLTRRLGIPAQVIADLRRAGGGGAIAAFQPDLVLSIRFSLIFPQWLIDLPPLGIINVHPGRLPAYGGLFAPFRQMLHGETVLGCTVHFIDGGIDTGPILSVDDVALDPARSMLWHTRQLYTAGALRLAGFVDRLASGGTLHAEPQRVEERGYYRFPAAAEFAAFAAAGFRIVTPEDYLGVLGLFMPAGGHP